RRSRTEEVRPRSDGREPTYGSGNLACLRIRLGTRSATPGRRRRALLPIDSLPPLSPEATEKPRHPSPIGAGGGAAQLAATPVPAATRFSLTTRGRRPIVTVPGRSADDPGRLPLSWAHLPPWPGLRNLPQPGRL